MTPKDRPYLGFHLVRRDPLHRLGSTVLGMASAMPPVEKQRKTTQVVWAGVGQMVGSPPLTAPVESDLAGDGFHSLGPVRVDPESVGPLAKWVDEQRSITVAAARYLRRDVDDGGTTHVAWQVSSHAPRNMPNDSPYTEVSAVCLADPFIDLLHAIPPARQRPQIEGLLDAIATEPTPWDYGYMELADWSEIREGRAYGIMMGNTVRWRQLIEYNVWQCYGMQPSEYKTWHDKYPVKGVYWGNYFGPQLLERLGGADRLKSHVDEECRLDKRCGWYRGMPGGALFLALSDDIGHVAYVDGFSQPNRAVTNAVWLWSVLREANVMI